MSNKKSILMVEDDHVSRMIVEKTLRDSGIDCQMVDNGKDALDLLREKRFDIILMDIRLPILDGIQVTKMIRTDPDFEHIKDIPIIALTAYAMPSDKEKFLNEGMDDYISKPHYPRDLFKILDKYGVE